MATFLNADSILLVTDLVKRYGQLRAVDGINLNIERGEIFGILGPNGAGKTTSLEMIEGLREPDSGQILLAGLPVWPVPGKTKELIGVQLQNTALFDYLTVREMLALFGTFYAKFLTGAEIDHLLEIVELTDKQKARVRELSGGQQQRLSIALALVNDPEIVFLDEPTTGLDPQARRRLWEVIGQIHARGKTLVLTTHNMEEAAILCNRVAIMDHGKVIALDTPQNLISGLDAQTKVAFDVANAGSAEALTAYFGDLQAQKHDSSFVMYTKDVQSTILDLFTRAETVGAQISNLSVAGANLEDVFLRLTGRGLRD